MTLKKVGSYAVIEQDVPEEIFATVLAALNFSTPYSLRLHLDGDREFSMSSIPEYIAEALRQTDSDETGDLFYALRKISGKGLNPFGATKKIDIKIGHCDSESDTNKTCRGMNGKKFSKSVEVVSCSSSHFTENSESCLILEDDSRIQLKNPRYAVYIAAVYNCDIEMDGQYVQDLKQGTTICSDHSRHSLMIDLQDAEKTPLLVGFDNQEVDFLQYYNYKNRIHAMDIQEPPEGYRFDADEFIYLAVRNGYELEGIEINSIDEKGVFAAEAVTNHGRFRMVPSNAFLLSRCIGVDAFVDEELVNMQEHL